MHKWLGLFQSNFNNKIFGSNDSLYFSSDKVKESFLVKKIKSHFIVKKQELWMNFFCFENISLVYSNAHIAFVVLCVKCSMDRNIGLGRR